MQTFAGWAALLWLGSALALFAESSSTNAPDRDERAEPVQRLDPAVAALIELEAADGTSVRPFEAGKSAVHVFLFLSNECPIANRYAPEFRRIQAANRDRGVRFWFVHPFADESRAAVAKHAREYSLPGTVLLDPGQRLTRMLGATVTPEAAVVDREYRLAYRGRIDDRFPQFGRERARATRLDLREALDAVLAGRPVAEPRTRAIGCSIPRVP
jgi:hypothetical protein